VKRPMGRPSLYDEKYCDVAIEQGRLGKSFAQIAAHIGIDKGTLTRWGDAHPDFRNALMLAKTYAQSYWEELGENGMHADKFNATVWRTSMQARFREDYTETTKTEISGNVRVEAVRTDLSLLSDEELETLQKILQRAKSLPAPEK